MYAFAGYMQSWKSAAFLSDRFGGRIRGRHIVARDVRPAPCSGLHRSNARAAITAPASRPAMRA